MSDEDGGDGTTLNGITLAQLLGIAQTMPLDALVGVVDAQGQPLGFEIGVATVRGGAMDGRPALIFRTEVGERG